MTALRLVIVGVAVAVAGLAQDFSAAVVKPPTTAVPAPSPLTPAERDQAFIKRARRVALSYTRNLPNFICTQTNRYFTSRSGDGYDWRQGAELAAEVQFVDGRESYRNVTVNGRPSNKSFTRIASSGEFGSSLYELFRPDARAVFTRSGDDVISGREVAVFRYGLANPRYGFMLFSGYNIFGREKRPISVGYRGLVSIGKATGNVLRYEIREILDIPPKHRTRQLSRSVDYGYVPIGGKPHLLPVRSRTDRRNAKRPYLGRQDVEWTDYRKFGAESTVDFE